MNKYKLEATCNLCQQPITSSDSGHKWRHVTKPARRHRAWATGTLSQVSLKKISREATDRYNALFGL